jgi:hypothetical protein
MLEYYFGMKWRIILFEMRSNQYRNLLILQRGKVVGRLDGFMIYSSVHCLQVSWCSLPCQRNRFRQSSQSRVWCTAELSCQQNSSAAVSPPRCGSCLAADKVGSHILGLSTMGPFKFFSLAVGGHTEALSVDRLKPHQGGPDVVPVVAVLRRGQLHALLSREFPSALGQGGLLWRTQPQP